MVQDVQLPTAGSSLQKSALQSAMASALANLVLGNISQSGTPVTAAPAAAGPVKAAVAHTGNAYNDRENVGKRYIGEALLKMAYECQRMLFAPLTL